MDDCSTEGLLALHARKIPNSRLEQLKVVAYGLGVSKEDLKKRSVFNDVITCITDKLGQEKEAITFAYNVLKLLDYHVNGLEKHIIPEPEYGDVRLKYPEIDLRLTVTNLVKDLEEKDYEILLSYVCSKSGVSTDGIKNRWDLVNLIFDELIKPKELTESPDDITLVCEVCDVFNHKRLILDYCSRQGKKEPEFVVSAHQMSQDQQESFYEFYYKRKQALDDDFGKRKKCTSKCIGCLSFWTVAALLTCTGIIAMICLTQISNTSQGAVNVTDSSLVILNPNGFQENLDHVKLTLITRDDNVKVDVFKGDCSKVNKTVTPLSPSPIPQLLLPYFKRQPYNYRGQDTPVYGVEGSYLDFNLSASTTNTNPGCLRIRIFNDYNLYIDATNPGEDNTTRVDGDIEHSRCLPVSTSGLPANGSWRYAFKNPQYVYTTVDEGPNVKIDGTITGSLVNYNMKHLLHVCQTLTIESNRCKVDICNKVCKKGSSRTQCFFVQSSENGQNKLFYETISYNNSGFFTSVGVTLFTVLFSLISASIGYVCLKLCCCSKKSGRNYTSLPTIN